MIGIIGAMDKEVDDLKNLMKDVSVEMHAGMDFWVGNLSGHELVLVRSGIGKVNAAVAAEALAAYYDVRAIINTGIAGSLDAKIDIGDIVLATDAMEHDMDVAGLGYEKGIVPDQETSVYPADADLRKLAKECCEKVNTDIKVFEGRVVSGDQFIADKATKEAIVSTVGGMCTEMEGAAIAHAAWLNKIPYLIIRSISDKADDSASVDYPTLQKIAIEHEVKLIVELMSKLSKNA